MKVRSARRFVFVGATALLVLGMPASADASPQTTTVSPKITSLAVTPTSVPGSGAAVTIHGEVTNATTCSLASVPTISGLPSSTSCAGGTFDASVTIPPNTKTTKVAYKFTLSATGTTKTVKKSKTVKEAVGTPSGSVITGFSANPDFVSAGGASVVLAATVTSGTTCALSSTPALTGLPSTQSCASGTVSYPVNLPANQTSSPVNYTFTLTTGSVNATTTATVGAAATANPPKIEATQTLAGSITWGPGVYNLTGIVTVPSGATLTLLAGTIIKTSTGGGLTVGGSLEALGTASNGIITNPVIFTSIADTSSGGTGTIGVTNEPGIVAANGSHVNVNGAVFSNTSQVISCADGGTIVATIANSIVNSSSGQVFNDATQCGGTVNINSNTITLGATSAHQSIVLNMGGYNIHVNVNSNTFTAAAGTATAGLIAATSTNGQNVTLSVTGNTFKAPAGASPGAAIVLSGVTSPAPVISGNILDTTWTGGQLANALSSEVSGINLNGNGQGQSAGDSGNTAQGGTLVLGLCNDTVGSSWTIDDTAFHAFNLPQAILLKNLDSCANGAELYVTGTGSLTVNTIPTGSASNASPTNPVIFTSIADTSSGGTGTIGVTNEPGIVAANGSHVNVNGAVFSNTSQVISCADGGTIVATIANSIVNSSSGQVFNDATQCGGTVNINSNTITLGATSAHQSIVLNMGGYNIHVNVNSNTFTAAAGTATAGLIAATSTNGQNVTLSVTGNTFKAPAGASPGAAIVLSGVTSPAPVISGNILDTTWTTALGTLI